ncbi:Salicylate hydroxylase [Collimonas arenae]|uniref:Salicylate hydroxylase n=1 Tax=Collimonas arenae TaxID=279058 RepID=A0A0A1FHC9_9BURK|nr:FAD-dependent monooxygenase [Collimonas arenae]AIY42252.1 Salicylate hydroxylase [Collimonas arenae]
MSAANFNVIIIGTGGILHFMELKWDRNGVKHGIGANDSALLAQWPGMLYDNTRDYCMWGFWAAREKFPSASMATRGQQLLDLAKDMTPDWHPALHKLMSLVDPSTALVVDIRTSVPIPAWTASTITLLGDAIHTMTPGRGVGANTALRDAVNLCRQLQAFRDGGKPLLQAAGNYKTEMREYGFKAVLDSRKQMDANAPIHKPFIGAALMHAARADMRAVNALPPLKRKIGKKLAASRGAERHASSLTQP